MNSDTNAWADARDPALTEIILQQSKTSNCLSEDLLLRYLDRTLPVGEQAQTLAHIRECPHCARIVSSLRPVFAPIGRLHCATLWRLFRQLKPASSQGKTELLEAWDSHCSRCNRCERRSALLAKLGVTRKQPRTSRPHVKQRLSAPSFAMGALCVLMLMLVTNRLGTHTGATIPTSNQTTDNSGVKDGQLPDMSAEGILSDLLAPTAPRRESALDVWKNLPASLDFPRQAALARIYLEAAQNDDNPKQRQEAIRQSIEAIGAMHRHETEILASLHEMQNRNKSKD